MGSNKPIEAIEATFERDFGECSFDRSDCLLLDLQMPGFSGIEVQQSLRLAGARFSIVIIRAHDSSNRRSECMGAGATTYLKPLDVGTFMQTVSPYFQTSA